MDPIAIEEFWGPEDALKYYELDGKEGVSRMEELFMFPNEAVHISVLQYSKEGGLTVPTVTVSAKGSSYRVIVDYAKYRIDSTNDKIYQSGIGIRMTAEITTSEANINISSLYGLGIAAKAGKLSGTLSFQTIGISGKQISSLVPLPSEISVESIQTAMQAAAAIKSNIYGVEDDVAIFPQVFAYKNNTLSE